MRKVLIGLIVITVLVGGALIYWTRRPAAQASALEILREAQVQRERLVITVNAAGTIEPEQLVSLTFGLAGTVQEVNVVRGQRVEAGDVLATLNSEELTLLAKQAEDALQIQELTLQRVLNSEPTPATLALAQSDIDAASANLEIANANVTAARGLVDHAEAQKELLRTQPRDERADAAEDLADAEIAIAKAGVQAANGGVEVAEANLDRAQAAYNLLLEPPDEDEIAVLREQVDSAQTNLELAQLRLEQSRITSPISGKVANVFINVGEQSTPGVPAITVVDAAGFHIDVNVDEIDIDQIAVGQEVDITLDALPDESVIGTISGISPTSTNTGGVIAYLVTINIDSEEQFNLRPGMSANASIVVNQIDDVLLVPNWAIRLDRETGQAFVNLKRPDGTIEEVVVETGLRNEQLSEVLGGLSEEDVVVLTDEGASFSLFGN
jgi:HlyD family secretion protein